MGATLGSQGLRVWLTGQGVAVQLYTSFHMLRNNDGQGFFQTTNAVQSWILLGIYIEHSTESC